MKRNVIKLCAFTTIVIVAGMIFYHVFSWKDTTSTQFNTWEHFYDSKEDTMDVIFYGSSHCYCTINQAVLWEKYGIAGFNLCASGQNIGSTYSYMKESLQSQHPKAMVVELFTAIGEDAGVENGNIYRNTIGMNPFSKNYRENIEYAADMASRDESFKTDLLLQIPVIHSRYNSLEKTDFKDSLYYSRGYYASWEIKEFDTPIACKENAKQVVPSNVLDYVDNMIELADEHECDIYFFVSPYYLGKDDQKKINYIVDYVKSKGKIIWDFNQQYKEIDFDYGMDMREQSHVNNYGANKVTTFIGDFLYNNYEFDKDVNDNRYILWNQDTNEWNHRIENKAITEITHGSDYVQYLEQLNDYTIIIYNDLNSDNTYFKKIYEIMKIDTEYNVVVINNGNEVYSDSTENEFTYYTELKEYSDMAIVHQNRNTSIVIDKEKFYKPNEFNIVVYDNVLGEVVEGITVDEDGNIVR